MVISNANGFGVAKDWGRQVVLRVKGQRWEN